MPITPNDTFGGYCCGCDRPLDSDWCPTCRETMGGYDPDEPVTEFHRGQSKEVL